jgi:hypothetical protein
VIGSGERFPKWQQQQAAIAIVAEMAIHSQIILQFRGESRPDRFLFSSQDNE